MAVLKMTFEKEVKEWMNAKYGGEIRAAGATTVRQIEKSYKLLLKHAWCSRAKRRRRRYF